MGQRVDEGELRRRAVVGLRDEVEAFGSGSPDATLLCRDGLIASVTPSSPQRSLFNSVYYEDPEVLAAELDGLERTYAEAGIGAWTVWVPDEDRGTARLMESRGHMLDAAPRAMAMHLDDLATAPPAPEGVEPAPGSVAIGAELNDRAYGYGPDGFRAALATETSIRWHAAYDDEEPVGCVGTIDVDDDCLVTGVATPSEHRGRGVAGWLLHSVLAEARGKGMRTSSLQATRAGAPLYERLGFVDLGFVEMWELRR